MLCCFLLAKKWRYLRLVFFAPKRSLYSCSSYSSHPETSSCESFFLFYFLLATCILIGLKTWFTFFFFIVWNICAYFDFVLGWNLWCHFFWSIFGLKLSFLFFYICNCSFLFSNAVQLVLEIFITVADFPYIFHKCSLYVGKYI